jgi:hypothetical protein
LPTTVVHASDLSMKAILDAIRAGHVFIDAQGSRDRAIDFVANVDEQSAEMGDTLHAPARAVVHVTMHATALANAHAEIIVDGQPIQPKSDMSIHGTTQTLSFDWRSDGKRHWIRANVRGADGSLLVVGNPIYINK